MKSNQTYSSGKKQFMDVCHLYKTPQSTSLPMFPADEDLLLQFVAKGRTIIFFGGGDEIS